MKMTESSTFSRPDWPVNALPRHWVEALFARMQSLYGDRLTAMWRGATVAEVHRTWAIELAKLSREQLKAGHDNLMSLPKPPTCPEFAALCRQARLEQVASPAVQVTDQRRADVETVDAHMQQIRPAVRAVLRREPTAEWAFELLLRGTTRSGGALPLDVRRRAEAAVASTLGGRVPEMAENPELGRRYAELRRRVLQRMSETEHAS